MSSALIPDADLRTADPRRGQRDRDKKAEAILRTVGLMAQGCELRQGARLDIGCGSGGIAAALAGQVRRVVGLDPEPWERWKQLCEDHPGFISVLTKPAGAG